MFPRRVLFLVGLLLCGRFAVAQTVVNSTFVSRFPVSGYDKYSNPNNWSPAEVPNNTGAKTYNVNISQNFSIDVDTNATIADLSLSFPQSGGGLRITDKTLAVTGTTTNQLTTGSISITASATGQAKFNAGTLSSFSNHVLSGSYSISSQGGPATLQFQHAAVSTISNGTVYFGGPLARMVDELGNDALPNLAHLDSSASLYITDHSMVTNVPFANDGYLSVGQSKTGTTFTAAVGLTNFDLATRTITGGNFAIGGSNSTVSPAELRFNGADIVNNGSVIQLIGPAARIADLAGADGLRNLARTLPNGVFLLSQHDFTIAGQFQNDGSLSLLCKMIFTISGALTNFDPATRTLSGGSFDLTQDAQLRFAGADIVHNGARLSVSEGATMTDLSGNDALRNFNDNLSSGEFTVGAAAGFTAPGDFQNAGKFTVGYVNNHTSVTGQFAVPAGFRFTQTGGATFNWGLFTADEIEILGGSIEGSGTYVGNLTVTNATIKSAPTIRQGNFTLNAGSHFYFNLFAQPQYEIPGKVTLGGTLEVDIPRSSFVSSATILTVLKSAQPLSGVFGNAPNGARIPTTDGKGSVVVTYDTKAVYVSQYQAEPPPAQLLNISSRAFLSSTADDSFKDRAVIIGGFIISGSAPKEIVLRGLGPSLASFGLDQVLADPVLELHASDGTVIADNDNWRDHEAAITAAGLAPSDDREAALRITLVPGTYTAVVKEKSGLAGYGLVEVYDLSQNSTSKLANISTRGWTDSTSVLIGGIVVGGSGQGDADVVVRALGPELRPYGILNALDDPTLEVRDENGNLLAFNDNHGSNFSQFNFNGLRPANSTESAMALSLPHGSFTAIVRAKGNTAGVALVEFYDLRSN